MTNATECQKYKVAEGNQTGSNNIFVMLTADILNFRLRVSFFSVIIKALLYTSAQKIVGYS